MTVKYQHEHKGKEFFTIGDIEYNSEHDSPMSFYTNYRARILENLKPKGTLLQWKQNTKTTATEVILPTFEDHILLTVLLIIDKRLPAKVKEIYGPRMEKEKFPMDLKSDILSNIPKILEELEDEESNVSAVKYNTFQAAYMGPPNRFRGRNRPRGNFRGNFNRQRSNYQQQNKFC